MEKRKLIALFALTVALIVLYLLTGAPNVYATVSQTKAIISNGGAHSSTGVTVMTSNLGEVLVGHSLSGSQEIWHGFYAPISQQTVSVVPLTPVNINFLRHPLPNPTHGSNMITFGLAEDEPVVTLAVYDISGRLVRHLINGPHVSGLWDVSWDLRSNTGASVHAGLYFVRLQTRSFTGTQRLVVVP